MKIALCLQGISYHDTYEKDGGVSVHYNTCIESLRTQVIQVLQNTGATVDLFLNTYEGPRMKDVLRDYQPKRYVFHPFRHQPGGFYVIPQLQRTCALLLEDPNFKDAYDYVIITRFDVYFYQPIDLTRMDWNKINYTWLGEDNFFWIPIQFLEPFQSCLFQCSTPSAHDLHHTVTERGLPQHCMYSHEELQRFQQEFPHTRCFYTIHRYITDINMCLNISHS